MKAWFIKSYGGPEVLECGELPEPVVGPRDVLVEVSAASVNPIDIRVRKGELKRLVKYAFPLRMGTDLAGVVTAVGSDVRRFAVGDAVYARPRISLSTARAPVSRPGTGFEPRTNPRFSARAAGSP